VWGPALSTRHLRSIHHILGVFAKLQKATFSFLMSLRTYGKTPVALDRIFVKIDEN